MDEVFTFLAALYGGLVTGAAYDVLRLLREPLPDNKWVNGVADALFYAVAGAIGALTLYRINGGRPRLHLLLAIGLGTFIWLKCVSPLLISVLSWMKRLAAKRLIVKK